MAKQYFIRQPDSDEERGPFTEDELASLAEIGQVDDGTLCHDETTTRWAPVSSNKELSSAIFPEKKKLTLRPREDEEMDLLNVDEDERAPITVDEMLATAEGDTKETRHVKRKVKWRDRTASITLPVLTLIMLLSTFNNIFPNYHVVSELLEEENYMALLEYPLLVVGLLDLFITVCLFLSATEIFPLLRLRAMIGLGYLGLFHGAQWYNGDPPSLYLMAVSIGATVGIFICTLTLNFILMLIGALLGIVGMGGYAYFMFFT